MPREKSPHQMAMKILLTIDDRFGIDPDRFQYLLTTGRLTGGIAMDITKLMGETRYASAEESLISSIKDAKNLKKKASKKELIEKGWIYKKNPLKKHEKEFKIWRRKE